jgi:uncharacterized protein (DUF2126 family)
VHAPLVFDIIDRWKDRSIGRCIYHAGRPDGHIYKALPVNATEAEERRLQRFHGSEQTPTAMETPKDENNPIFPMTLDLRLLSPAHESLVESPRLDR